jgi:8-oxo-dGTP pyrophosphatase MutT (NUDIX family)
MDISEHMVVGFMFDDKFERVLLLRKASPEWQRGLLNGVGGHRDDHDPGTDATMRREFKEETGIDTELGVWKAVATLRGKSGWRVWVMATVAPRAVLYQAAENTRGRDEVAEVVLVDEFQDRLDLVNNVSWLVPLAVDRLTNLQAPTAVVVDYDE